ncbi:MAG: prolyl oligopeptidase family serine peptidase [Acidimicrobiales bacterium]
MFPIRNRRSLTAVIATAIAAAALSPIVSATAKALPELSGWEAASPGISGTSQYVRGEWVAQDFVYDDASRADNAADIVEVRARKAGDDLEVRVVLNTLRSSDNPVIGVALGSGESRPWPFAAGVSSTWTSFVTVTNTSVVLTNGASGASTAAAAPAIDLDSNAIGLTIKNAAQTDAITLNVGSGVWDAANNRWASGTGVIDLAFNREDQEAVGKNWRDAAQRAAITAGDVSAFSAPVDIKKLKAKDTELFVPSPGTHNRVYRSVQSLGEGFGSSFPRYRGLYQPYSLFLPSGWAPGQVRPLTLAMHSLNNTHNEYNGTNVYPELAERRGAIAVTPLALGVDGWYWDEALVDALQVWADVRANYGIDQDATSIGGYSMGGYATYRLTTLLPDRFAAAAMWAGVPAYQIWPYPAEPVPSGPRRAPGKTYDQLENTEHIPFLVGHGTNDELVPVTGVVAQTERMHDLGHEYRFNLHPGQDHFTFTILNNFTAQGVWLRDHPRRAAAPGHVGFKVRPWSWTTTAADGSQNQVILDHIAALGYDLRSAYWVSGVGVADGIDPTGFVNLTSHAVALRKPLVTERAGAEATGSSPHTVRGLYRTQTPLPVANKLSGSLTGVTKLTVDLAATGLRMDGLVLDITVDRTVTLHLRDGSRTRSETLTP